MTENSRLHAGGSFARTISIAACAILLALTTVVVTYRPIEGCHRLAQAQALEAFADSTHFFDEQMHGYRQTYAERMRGLSLQNVPSSDAKIKLISQLTPMVRNSAIFRQVWEQMEALFPAFTWRQLNWDEIESVDRNIFDEFTTTVADSYSEGKDPATDDSVKSRYDDYLRFRRDVLADCRRHFEQSGWTWLTAERT